jgi:hypothetical protein
MALSYVPPGVLPAREILSSPQASNVSSQVVPVIIGEAEGKQSYSENIVLSGTTPVNFTNKGLDVTTNGSNLLNLAVTATNPVTYESISPANYVVELVSSGTATGDEQYSVRRVLPSPAPTVTFAGTVSSGTVDAVSPGQYRYATSYLVNVETGGGTTIYETGIGPAGTVDVTGDFGGSVTLDNMEGIPTDINEPIGKNIYRSENLGTNLNPNWGPYYKVTSGTAASINMGDSSYTDIEADVSGNSRVVSATIEDGDVVNFQYNYTNTLYWEPTLFDNFDDVVDKYGNAFTATGGIDSELSFAAKMAILNGAGTVVLVPIAAGGGSNDTNWEDALLKLEDDVAGNIVVPISGRTDVHALVSAHVTKMKQRNVWKSAVLGMDGVAGTVTADTLRATAESYNNSDLVLVSPAIFNYYNSYLNVEVPIGGQYAAAGIAGMHASRPLAESLTRKQLAGLSSLGERRTLVAKNQDGGSGLCVIEQLESTGTIRVRHEITTEPTDVNTREYPVILQRNNMVTLVADAIDRTIIGQIYADTSAPSKVSTLVSRILDNLVVGGNLGAYQNVTSRFAQNDPTTIEVRWQYKPLYTVQYVQITFGINLNSGTITTGTVNLIL